MGTQRNRRNLSMIPMDWKGGINPREMYGCVANSLLAQGTEGLGVLDLKLTEIALQSRWLWLQHTDEQRAWSELPIKTTIEVQAFFRASTYTVLGNGNKMLF
jgi:hypothetical protein